MKVAAALAALVAVASSAVLSRGLPRDIYIESIAVSGPKAEVSGLFASQVHSGAGLNDIAMIPIYYAEPFHYNTTSRQLYKREKYYYALGLGRYGPQAERYRDSYKIVQFDIFGSPHDEFAVSETDHYISPVNKPVNFTAFSVCNVKNIASDEVLSSYQQLLWRDGPPLAGCTDVNLKLTGYGGGV